MKRMLTTAAAIMALIALTALSGVTTAAAEVTKILPEPTEAAPTTFIAKSGEAQLVQVSGNIIKCEKDAGNGTFTNANLGYGKTLFEECTYSSLDTTCTGEGAAAGTIAVSSTIHYVLALEMLSATTSTLVPAFAFLVKQFHFTCSNPGLGISILVLVRGCVGGVEYSAEKLTKNVRVDFERYVTGENRILSILMENNTKAETKCLLESSLSEEPAGEKFELSALVGEAVLEKWRQNGVEIEVLLMDK